VASLDVGHRTRRLARLAIAFRMGREASNLAHRVLDLVVRTVLGPHYMVLSSCVPIPVHGGDDRVESSLLCGVFWGTDA
jgi:hypothetical protein